MHHGKQFLAAHFYKNENSNYITHKTFIYRVFHLTVFYCIFRTEKVLKAKQNFEQATEKASLDLVGSQERLYLVWKIENKTAN